MSKNIFKVLIYDYLFVCITFKLHAVTIYKGHVIRDTFLRLVKFMRKIRDRLVLGNKFTASIEIFTLKLPFLGHDNSKF